MAGETARGLALVDEHVEEFPARRAARQPGRQRHRLRRPRRPRGVPDGASSSAWPPPTATTGGFSPRWPSPITRWIATRSRGACPSARSSSIPGNANASHNLAHIYFETARHRRRRGVPADVDGRLRPARARSTATSRGTWRMFELHRGRLRARAGDLRARHRAAVNPRLAMIDGAALLWRFGLDGQPTRARCPGGRSPTWPSASPGPASSSARSTRHWPTPSCGDEAALAKLMDGLRALDAKGHPIAGTVALPLVQGRRGVRGRRLTPAALAHIEPVERRDPPHGRQPRPVGALRGDDGRLPPQAQPAGRGHHAPSPPPRAPPVPQRSTMARPGPISRRISHANTRMNLWRQTWAT